MLEAGWSIPPPDWFDWLAVPEPEAEEATSARGVAGVLLGADTGTEDGLGPVTVSGFTATGGPRLSIAGGAELAGPTRGEAL